MLGSRVIKGAAVIVAGVFMLGLAACDKDSNDHNATPIPPPSPTPTTSGSASSCAGPGGRCIVLAPSDNDLETILAAFIDAQPGDVIFLTAGTYHVNGQLSLDVDDVTVRGEGMDKTVINFRDQDVGGESLLVMANNFTIEDVGLEDGTGDLLKVIGGDQLTVRRVRTEWTGGPNTTNGSYGIYPVQCSNVLVEDSFARGASDTGIYVGQSHNIIVRRNTVEENVAGIEIENSTDADVYENMSTKNAGGILVFNLPGLQIHDGRRTRVFNNDIFDNNTPNFAPKGNIVGSVPTGTGFMVLANDQVQVFGNRFSDNGFAHVVIIGYKTATVLGGFTENDPAYDTFSESIYVHDNSYEGEGDGNIDVNPVIGPAVIQLVGGPPLPQILTDGDVDPDKFVDGVEPGGLRNCFHETGVTFADLDIDGGFANINRDISLADCQHEPLPAIVIPGVDDGSPTPSVTAIISPPPVTPTPVSGNVETRCTVPDGSDVNFDPEQPSCELLSSYRLFLGNGSTQEPNEGVLPYDLNTQLFADYAVKHRFIWLPPGTSATYDENLAFQFPVGAVIVKTFAYPVDARDSSLGEHLQETRLLVHRAQGWVGLPYVWNDDQTEARLTVVGDERPVSWIDANGATQTDNYHVPNANQCKQCHQEHNGIMSPLGPKARNLNKDYAYADGTENQLVHWTRVAYLTGAPADPTTAPRAAVFDDPSTGTVEERARTYLDVNCAHCHNPSGLARPSGLYLTIDQSDPAVYGVCKSPVAAGIGSGGFSYDIAPGDPDSSILVYRMASTQPGIAMPELGRQKVHTEALAVIRDWIDSIEGSCTAAP